MNQILSIFLPAVLGLYVEQRIKKKEKSTKDSIIKYFIFVLIINIVSYLISIYAFGKPYFIFTNVFTLKYLCINRYYMRESRNLSAYTKQQISNSMKKYHARKSEQAKIATRTKQSMSMKNYWCTIPDGDKINTSTKGCISTTDNQSNVVQPTKKI